MKKDKWLQGYACCLASMINKGDIVDTPYAEAYREAGLASMTEKQMRQTGIDDYDIETFKKHDLLT